jgi:hypothetical protein
MQAIPPFLRGRLKRGHYDLRPSWQGRVSRTFSRQRRERLRAIEWIVNEVLGRTTGRLSPEITEPQPIELSEGNEMIAAIRSIPVRQGYSSSSIPRGPLAQEFIHIGLSAPGRELHGPTPDKLTAIVVGYGSDGPSLLPAFASVSTALPIEPTDAFARTTPARCTIRLNLAGMLGGTENLDVFLLKDNLE